MFDFRKILLVMLISAAGSASFAVEAEVHRFQKELSDACLYTVSTSHSYYDTYQCISQKAANPQIWRTGWNKAVKADVLSPLANNFSPDLAQTCDTGAAELVKSGKHKIYYANFSKLAETLKKQCAYKKKYKLQDLNLLINGHGCKCL